jgi:putative ABC transport system ATP-binding protein
MIEAQELRKTYGEGRLELEVLRGVSLEIDSGEFVALRGPSGSGKTTLLSIIGCLDRPTAGRLVLNGRELSELGDRERTALRRRDIGFVFQAFNLLPTLSALENVAFQLRLLGWRNDEARRCATETLESVGLGGRLEHRPGELSGGEQQRVAIARAIAKSPSLLLADEPTGTLDTQNGAAIFDLLADLNEAGQTIVLVTHDLELASRAKRVLILCDGVLSQEGR